MSKKTITNMTLVEISRGIKKKDFSCVEIMQAYLNNIEEYNNQVNAIVAIDPRGLLEQSQKYDQELKQGKYRGPLHGIPMGVKDNFFTTDYPTTACSEVLKGAKPDASDANLVRLLKDNGAIVMAKTNMHEWAYGATNYVSRIGSAKNPWNTEFISGGSSGGSAVGVASNFFPFALGSDTGGSIRIPSSCCNITGLKPTYGRVSKQGVYPVSFSLDVVGPMAKSAEELTFLYKIILKESNNHRSIKNFSKLRFAVPTGYNFERNPDVEKVFNEAVAFFKQAGATVEEVKIPFMEEGLAAFLPIVYAEASAYHQKNLLTLKDKYTDTIRLLLAAGERVSAIDYLKACQFRRLFIDSLNKVYEDYDALLFTTTPVTPSKIGVDTVEFFGKKISPFTSMIYLTWLANFSGCPQITLPSGFGNNNLPVGLAIMGPAGADFNILNYGELYQQANQAYKKVPPILV